LDIETDDVEAEVKRLGALGARRVKQIKRWWVMEAPTGQRSRGSGNVAKLRPKSEQLGVLSE